MTSKDFLKDRITRLGYDQAKTCMTSVLERHVAKHGTVPSFVVVVGGTALAAHGIRELSEDVDYFAPEIDMDVVQEVETELKGTYGPKFKIDATPTENLWGPIIFRDIAMSEDHDTIEVAGHVVSIKRLSPEDLVMTKLVANRSKDLADLHLLAGATNPDKLVERFNTIIKWHGDRSAALSFTDSFVSYLESDHGQNGIEVAERLDIPSYVKEMIVDARTMGDEGPP